MASSTTLSTLPVVLALTTTLARVDRARESSRTARRRAASRAARVRRPRSALRRVPVAGVARRERIAGQIEVQVDSARAQDRDRRVEGQRVLGGREAADGEDARRQIGCTPCSLKCSRSMRGRSRSSWGIEPQRLVAGGEQLVDHSRRAAQARRRRRACTTGIAARRPCAPFRPLAASSAAPCAPAPRRSARRARPRARTR